MKEDSGTLIELVGEDGEKVELEHIDTFESEGRLFLVFLPAFMDPNDEQYGFVLMEAFPGEDGEQYLEPLADEDEERIYNLFMERLYGADNDLDEDENYIRFEMNGRNYCAIIPEELDERAQYYGVTLMEELGGDLLKPVNSRDAKKVFDFFKEHYITEDDQ